MQTLVIWKVQAAGHPQRMLAVMMMIMMMMMMMTAVTSVAEVSQSLVEVVMLLLGLPEQLVLKLVESLEL